MIDDDGSSRDRTCDGLDDDEGACEARGCCFQAADGAAGPRGCYSKGFDILLNQRLIARALWSEFRRHDWMQPSPELGLNRATGPEHWNDGEQTAAGYEISACYENHGKPDERPILYLDISQHNADNSVAALSTTALDWLKRTVLNKAQHGAPVSVIEFGSGKSTMLLSQIKAAYQISNLRVISYDSSAQWAAAPSAGVDVRVRGLSSCTDEAFERMFAQGRYDSSEMSDGRHLLPLDWHNRNAWYQLPPAELMTLCAFSDPSSGAPSLVNAPFDVVLVDGPNGNGRSLAFLAIQHCVAVGTVFFIDDHLHYDFVPRLQQVFKVARIHGGDPNSSTDDKECTATGEAAGQCARAVPKHAESEEGRFAIYQVTE
jgi:hypothetical protein